MRLLFYRQRSHGTAEFHLRCPENVRLAKRVRDGGLLICATVDHFSQAQSEAFAHYLYTNGFISGEWIERSGWTPGRPSDHEGGPVRWIIDPIRPEVDPAGVKHKRLKTHL